jgi:hypothetical protein
MEPFKHSRSTEAIPGSQKAQAFVESSLVHLWGIGIQLCGLTGGNSKQQAHNKKTGLRGPVLEPTMNHGLLPPKPPI